MVDGEWLRMRLSAEADADGWLKMTRSAAPTSKLLHSSASECDCWWMTVVAASGVVMLPSPATRVPPCGAARSFSPR